LELEQPGATRPKADAVQTEQIAFELLCLGEVFSPRISI
jgi:hypothetical protein